MIYDGSKALVWWHEISLDMGTNEAAKIASRT